MKVTIIMNLSQRKLNKSEWNSVEIPVSLDEKNIIRMLENGFFDVNISHNPTKTLMSHLKIEYNDINDKYIYIYYLKDKIKKLMKKYELAIDNDVTIDAKKISKVNKMRIENNTKQDMKDFEDIYEFTLLDLVNKMLKNKQSNNYKWCIHYYTLTCITHYDIHLVNRYFISFVKHTLNLYKEDVEVMAIIAKGKEYIECNEYLLKYSPNKLYSHQKDIFRILQKKESPIPRLIMYTAPTATGKTLTPIALSQQYRVIFVCAARHVGVALAKSAISVGKKIAFAFGCDTADDIRLHYFAAKTYEKHRKSGGIHKVDNSDGVNVEIMICDIKSYLCAMYYMLSFNDTLGQTNNDLVMFWDEPTITMDYETHECHEHITKNWRNNEIPNIVLSSATLPSNTDIHDTIESFQRKFPHGEVHRVTSAECKKTIQLVDTNGNIALPHLYFKEYDDLRKCITYCSQQKTLYRYFDLHEICKFITFLQDDDNVLIHEDMHPEKYFTHIKDITMENIKEYYFKLLFLIKEETWSRVYQKFHEMDHIGIARNKIYPKLSNGMNITTCDAFTLTDGPTIFIAEDVEKIAKFCIQQAKIPQDLMNAIQSDIQFNNTINNEMTKINKSLEDILQKDLDAGNEKKMGRDLNPETRQLRKKLDDLNALYRDITLDKTYVPNSVQHLVKWFDTSVKNTFTASISNTDVQRVMELNNIDDIWRILLLMGIGLFSSAQPIEYTEIVKEFADEQKLYLIIANGDYIYGTNYQFCHAFIGKDLDITQEKMIQAMGRVGRNKLQQTYSIRVRREDMIDKILLEEEDKIEVKNMNRLFNDV